MHRVIGQERPHQLPEPQIQEERTTVRARPSAHLRDLQLGEHANNLVHGKILWSDRSISAFHGSLGETIDTYDGTTTSVANHEVLIGGQLVHVCEVGAVHRGGFRLAAWNTVGWK